jgi:hypothetical protein
MRNLIRAAVVAATLLLTPAVAHAQSTAPGQAHADYLAWLARSPENREAVRSFRTHLATKGVEDIIPTWQLIRTSSSWRQCAAERFEVAPVGKWDNMVKTLSFVRDEVAPVLGGVEALSVYRNEKLNSCSRGAPKSAHARFFALDLVPASEDVERYPQFFHHRAYRPWQVDAGRPADPGHRRADRARDERASAR